MRQGRVLEKSRLQERGDRPGDNRRPISDLTGDGGRRQIQSEICEDSVRSESWEVRRKKSAGARCSNILIMLKRCFVRQAAHKRTIVIRVKHMEIDTGDTGMNYDYHSAAANVIS